MSEQLQNRTSAAHYQQSNHDRSMFIGLKSVPLQYLLCSWNGQPIYSIYWLSFIILTVRTTEKSSNVGRALVMQLKGSKNLSQPRFRRGSGEKPTSLFLHVDTVFGCLELRLLNISTCFPPRNLQSLATGTFAFWCKPPIKAHLARRNMLAALSRTRCPS